MSPSVRPDPPSPNDPAARPRPLAQRLGLLLILLVLPAAVVTVPSLVVTHLFGQRPRPKAVPAAASSGLRAYLDQNANALMPTPAPLAAEPVRVPVLDPSHVGPRTEKVKAQAQRLGGTAVEGLATDGEKHLFVDLPAGTADAFRRAVTENTPVESLATPAPPSPGTAAARDQVEVFIRPAAKDE